MKKVLLNLLGVLLTLPALAFDYTYRGQTLSYAVIDENAKTCKVNKGSVSGALVIPSVAKDGDTEYSVTSIGDAAFGRCTGMTSIEIPNSITSIGHGAFNGCDGLTSVVIPNSVTYIGNSAFGRCEGLTSVVIPNSVTEIAAGAFQSSGLTSVVIPTSVTSIGYNTFRTCSRLASVVIPNSITEIGEGAFYGCRSLTLVEIPTSVTSIGYRAFCDCTSLSSVVIPNSITEIEVGAFYGCTSLSSVAIPNSVTSIGPDAFRDCSSLTSIEIPNSVTSIGQCAFYNCSSLSSVAIPNSVTSIGQSAFYDCSLTKIIVPPSVETIGAGAFYSFYSNVELSSIIMAHSVKTIGDYAFNGDDASTVYITAQTPPTASDNVFKNYNGLYVQGEKAYQAYRDAPTCWNRFEVANIKTMIEPESIDMGDSPKAITGKPGDTFQLTAKLLPDNVTLPQVFWRSTNPDIAYVDNNGLVTIRTPLDEVMAAAETDDDTSASTCKIIAESLYANGPVAEVTVNAPTLGVDDVVTDTADGGIDFTAPLEVYNLNGYKMSDTIDGLHPGIYIVKQGSRVTKMIVK